MANNAENLYCETTSSEESRSARKKRCDLSPFLGYGLTCFLQGLDGNMTLTPIVHEIRIQNQFIFLDPPIEYARDSWFKQLHEWLGVVCRLRRIQSSRYEIGLQIQESSVELTYTFLVRVASHFQRHTNFMFSSRGSPMGRSKKRLD